MPDARSDEVLLAAAAGGDARAFEVLYWRYRDWALRLATRFSADHDAALDVVQETFLYLLRKLPDLRLTARLTTFLYPAVKHLALTRRRQDRRTRMQLEEWGPAAADDAGAAGEEVPGAFGRPRAAAADSGVAREDCAAPRAEPGDARAELGAALSGLPEAQREVLLMRFVDDMSLAEIAAALSIPLGTVKSRLHHALATLRADPRTRAYFDR